MIVFILIIYNYNKKANTGFDEKFVLSKSLSFILCVTMKSGDNCGT